VTNISRGLFCASSHQTSQNDYRIGPPNTSWHLESHATYDNVPRSALPLLRNVSLLYGTLTEAIDYLQYTAERLLYASSQSWLSRQTYQPDNYDNTSSNEDST
jgi:hypothetical protein